MKRITIGTIPGEKPQPLTLDVHSLVANRLLIQANSGGGKSNAVRLLVEKLAGVMPCIVIDAEGEYHTLREKVDLVLVGDGGELAASPKNAGELAIKLLSLGVSAVIDIFGLAPVDRREYVRRYCENIIAAPRSLWRPFMLVIDEAQLFCPQDSESVATLPITHLMTLARKRQICAVLATPRLAQIDTDARAPINNFLIGRATLDNDYKRGADVLGMPRSEARSLASLRMGQFHAFGPSFGHDGVMLGQLDKAQTDAPKTGKASTRVPSPSAAIKAVVPELEKIATAQNPDEVSTIEKARARIKEQAKQLSDAKRDLSRAQQAAEKAAAAPAKANPDQAAAVKSLNTQVRQLAQQVEELMRFVINVQARDFKDAEAAEIQKAITAAVENATKRIESMLAGRAEDVRKLKAEAAKLQAKVEELGNRAPNVVTVDVEVAKNAPFTVAPVRPLRSPTTNGHVEPKSVGDLTINKTQQRILDALAWYESLGNAAPTLTQIGAVALIDPTGGHFSNTVGPLSTNGLVVRGDGSMSLTDAGRAVAQVPESAGDLEGYHDVLRQRIRKMKSANGKTIEILDVIIGAEGGQITTEQIGQAVGIDHTGGHFSNSIGPLGTAGLIVRRDGVVTPTEVLFPKGLS